MNTVATEKSLLAKEVREKKRKKKRESNIKPLSYKIQVGVFLLLLYVWNTCWTEALPFPKWFVDNSCEKKFVMEYDYGGAYDKQILWTCKLL